MPLAHHVVPLVDEGKKEEQVGNHPEMETWQSQALPVEDHQLEGPSQCHPLAGKLDAHGEYEEDQGCDEKGGLQVSATQGCPGDWHVKRKVEEAHAYGCGSQPPV